MRPIIQDCLVLRQLAAYLLLSTNAQVYAIPAPQDAPNTGSSASGPVPATEVATGTDGKLITEVFTPTTIAVSGLAPPITAPTTITQVITSTDGTAETVAVAVAAGAGIVAAGALAAWLFKPVPGQPPAPTTPPNYPTSSEPDPPSTNTDDDSDDDDNSDTANPTTTSLPPAACPFTPVNPISDFKSYTLDPTWTGPLPSLTTSSVKPACTSQGANNQLFRGTDPGYVNTLAGVFCNKTDLSKNEETTLGDGDLPAGSNYKNEDINIKFDFASNKPVAGCAQNCINAYKRTVSTCQFNSHSLYGGASIMQGCGNYSFMIDAEPNTKQDCNPIDKQGANFKYMYRDAAIQQITDFCNSVDGKSVKQHDTSTNINSGPFSITYAEECQGSGTYKITKAYCNKYLALTVDNCDTDTRMFKHGGTLTDIDNCGQFKFTPSGYDSTACYPGNQDRGYIISTNENHLQITHAMASDAITQFCSRTGQATTLDPGNIPSGGDQDTCTKAGYAACAYFYSNDGSRVTKKGDTGDISIRVQAEYFEPDGQKCQPKQKYDISGDRCVQELNKVLDGCNTNSLDKKDLGSFVENAENGCVRWDFWAVKTH